MEGLGETGGNCAVDADLAGSTSPEWMAAVERRTVGCVVDVPVVTGGIPAEREPTDGRRAEEKLFPPDIDG